jgi:hypothetical protein
VAERRGGDPAARGLETPAAAKTIRGDGMPSPQDVYAGMMKTAFGPAFRSAGLRGSNGQFEVSCRNDVLAHTPRTWTEWR